VVVLLEEYPKFLIVNCDNIGSKLMQDIRRSLRPSKSVLLMGKNTLIRKAIQSRLDDHPEWAQFLPYIKQNVGIVLTKGSLAHLREKLQENMSPTVAKPGIVAPVDVFITKQITNLEPSKTSFFASLNIATKINKGTVEILNSIKICEKGKKVGSSEAALLQMLDVKPFVYGAKIITCFSGSVMFPPEYIEFSETPMGLDTLSMVLSHPSVATFPQVIVDGFKNLVAVSIETNYDFSQAEQFKILNSGSVTLADHPGETHSDGEEGNGGGDDSSGEDPDPFLDFF